MTTLNHLHVVSFPRLILGLCKRKLFIVGLTATTLTSCVAIATAQPEAATIATRVPDTLVEATSLLGTPLTRPELPADQLQSLTENLELAVAELRENPDSLDHHIWVGRRLAYLWRYRDAVEVYSRALEQFGPDAKLLRHRGHRYITLRQFDLAIADLSKAAELTEGTPDEVEPDGQPNAAGVTTSTLHTNIWYHLGLAQFLVGDYERSLESYERCLKLADNDDMRVATLDWIYTILARLNRIEEAQQRISHISADIKLVENHVYLRRLLFYQGELDESELLAEKDAKPLDLATFGFGIGNWHLAKGNQDRAEELFQQTVAGTYWSAFGYIAAEADLARWKQAD